MSSSLSTSVNVWVSVDDCLTSSSDEAVVYSDVDWWWVSYDEIMVSFV